MTRKQKLIKSCLLLTAIGVSAPSFATDHKDIVYNEKYLESDDYQAVGFEYFEWLEDNDSLDIPSGSEYGEKIVLNFGSTEKWRSDTGYYNGYDLAYKFGMNSYHGQGTIEGEEKRDIDTRSVYFDFEYFYNFSYRYPVTEDIALDAKAYLGAKHWSRIITSTEVELSDGEVVDFNEYHAFFGLYAKTGLGMKIGNNTYLEAGVSAPLGVFQYNNNDDNDGILYPKSDIGYYAEAEYRIDDSYYAKIYLTQYNYAQSSTNDSGFYQSDTKSTTYGITVGQYF